MVCRWRNLLLAPQAQSPILTQFLVFFDFDLAEGCFWSMAFGQCAGSGNTLRRVQYDSSLTRKSALLLVQNWVFGQVVKTPADMIKAPMLNI